MKKEYFLCLFLLIFTAWSSLTAQEMRVINYEESFEIFPNPERGFHQMRSLINPVNLDSLGKDVKLIYGRILADEFRFKPFSEEFLQSIQAGFDEARKHGIKVNPRVVYNSGPHPGSIAQYGDDAPLHIVLQHIEQLKPLWHKNKDVINLIDAGFIGGWGEWHSSAYGLDSLHNRRIILFAILDALPKDRMVIIRAPQYKRGIFTGDELNGDSLITRETAFNGSNLSRVGFLNDCFLSSENDVGTYAYTDQCWPIESELDYIGSESRYVPFGGETCRLDDRGKCDNAVLEMEKLHVNYLNQDYNRRVLGRWKDEGCFDEIQRRLGYRFVLRKASLPNNAVAGNAMDISFDIYNRGFGELFNPRNVEIVLINNKTKEEQVAILSEEPRFWGAGENTTIKTKLSIPADLAPGDYTLGIRMPDIESSIHNDPRYSIRFANENTWVADTGTNVLTKDFIISAPASGVKNESYKKFSEIK